MFSQKKLCFNLSRRGKFDMCYHLVLANRVGCVKQACLVLSVVAATPGKYTVQEVMQNHSTVPQKGERLGKGKEAQFMLLLMKIKPQ